jgi:hypothetical protein
MIPRSRAPLLVFLLGIQLSVCGRLAAAEQQSPVLDSNERKELELYRQCVQKLVADIKSAQLAKGNSGYFKYLNDYYEQQIEQKKIRNELYRWQIFAGNAILVLVVIMSLGGFAITAFQIWQAFRLNQSQQEISFSASIHQIQVTTSVTGVVVLVISFVFLIAFLHEVYVIRGPVVASVESGSSTGK